MIAEKLSFLELTLKILCPSYKDITGVLIYKTLLKDSNIQVGDILMKFDGMKVDLDTPDEDEYSGSYLRTFGW